LSICDFFLWGYLKEQVFKHRPHTLPQLRERIIGVAANGRLLTAANGIFWTLFSELKDYKW
jgi:hypothetical protein